MGPQKQIFMFLGGEIVKRFMWFSYKNGYDNLHFDVQIYKVRGYRPQTTN